MQTKAEFYNYIDDTYHKKAGQYTLDELYEIGLIHKTLPKNQKNWKELAEYVGYPGTPEHYRLSTLRNSKKSGGIRIQDEAMIMEDPESYEAMYKQKTQIRDIYNSYRASLRASARDESFKEMLYEAVSNLEPLKFDPIKTNILSNNNFNEAVLLLSDLHIGVNCSNFYNTYNSDVAKERLEVLAGNVISYCKLFNVKKLNICNLGDLIQGTIHTTARIEADKNAVEQIKTAAELVAKFLERISNELKIQILYRSCTDNHSRMIPNIAENMEAENFSTLIDWYLEPRLKLSKSPIIFADDNIDISIGKFDLHNGKKIMFAHGHLDGVNKCVDNFIGATREFIDYVLLAHYHNSKEKSYGSSKVFVNGSVVGTEQYAFGKRLFGPAEQKLLIFDGKNISDITINLQD